MNSLKAEITLHSSHFCQNKQISQVIIDFTFTSSCLKLKNMRKVIIPILMLLALLTSCVVTESITAGSGFEGTSKTDITVDPFFLSVLEDFSSFTSGDGYTVMDDAMVGFASAVNSSSSASNVRLLSDGEGKRYIISFDYTSLVNLLKDLNGGKGNSLFTITSSSLSFNLTMDNYTELKDVIPFLSDENFEVYGPEYSNGMTEEEYTDMITFLLGDESPEALQSSSVSITIKVPGTVDKVTGAEKTASDTVVYTFPVIDFLLLNEPLSFSISWK